MRWTLYSIIFFIFLLSSYSFGADLSGNSRTYLRFMESTGDDKFNPLYEYLDFHMSNINGKDISFFFGGWLSYDLADVSFNKRYDNNLQYAFIQYNHRASEFTAELGSFYVFEGVASEQIDGVYVKKYFRKKFGLTVYGGIPVETDFDERGGDSIYGGRLSFEGNSYVLGLSYLKEKNDSSDFREETGIDLYLRPLNEMELTGHSVYNIEQSGWQEHSYYLSINPAPGLYIKPLISWFDYRNFFYSPTTSAFRFDPAIIDPDEKLLTYGGTVEYNAGSFIISGDYRRHDYEIHESADYYGGGITYSSISPNFAKKKANLGISVHRMDGKIESLKYNEYRIFASLNLNRIGLAADLIDINYDLERNGVRNAYAISGYLGYSLTKNLILSADAEYGKNPEFDREVKTMLKVIYRL